MSSEQPHRSARANGGWQPSLIQTFRHWLRELTGQRDGDSLRETLEELIEEREEGHERLGEEERALLINVLSFGELRVADVMVPRADIIAAERGVPLEELIRIMREAGHTRIPIFRETLDDVVGMVHIKDLLVYWGDGRPFDIDDILRPVLSVPPSMPVRDLLLEMRAARIHMAVVVDEFGGTDGLATIEDLVEEIVGEIQDEHDKIRPARIVESADGTFEADARVPIEAAGERLGVSLLPEEREGEVDTLGGLVVSLAGRVPARGELIVHPAGLTFEVLEADARRVKRLKIGNLPPRPAPIEGERE
jgi:CBS domain containing-hemolysin-like protein